MLMALLCALQVASAGPAPTTLLTVRVGDRTRTVPILEPAGGAVLRADLLAEALGGQLVAEPRGRYRFVLAERAIRITASVPWLQTDSTQYPLVTAPYRADGRLYVPISLVTDVLPRLFTGLLYDGERGELRRFSMVAARPAGSVPKAIGERAATAGESADTLGNALGFRHRVVVVDAGHGGPDNGMSGPLGAPRKVHEKDITLAVSLALRRALEKRDVTVVMTRSTDTLIALADRGRIANQARGDLFISVHVNAANPGWNQPGTARGFETYFLAEAKTEDEKRVEAMENESIRFETSAETSRNDPLGFIIRDMAQNEHLRESSMLADLVQQQLKATHPGPNRGIKQAGFSVLVRAFMPAVLVEIGFGSNAAESAYMTDARHQAELADAIASAAVAYLAQYERKVGPGTP